MYLQKYARNGRIALLTGSIVIADGGYTCW
jgi:hypothetical protein